MKIVTFNIRCPWKNCDGINDFIHRAGFIFDKINRETPDVIAFQEVSPDSCILLQKMFPEYDFFGSFREKGYTIEGLYTAIRKDGFSFMGSEVFWLSPTPFVVASRFENQSLCSRICLMTKVRNKQTNEVFRFYNVHLDHISKEARMLGLKCVFEFMNEYDKREKLPNVILGDFNAAPQDSVIQFACNKMGLFDATKDIAVTYHEYGKTEEKIDYIFLSQEIQDRVGKVEIWQDNKDGIYLSDHYPVCLTLGN